MSTTAMSYEMMKNFVQLSKDEQKSLLQMIKAFLNNKKINYKPQTIDEYNKEIKAALRRAKRGEVTSIDKLEQEMKL